MQELEEEVLALAAGRQQRARLKELMNKKELVGDVFNQVTLRSWTINDCVHFTEGS